MCLPVMEKSWNFITGPQWDPCLCLIWVAEFIFVLAQTECPVGFCPTLPPSPLISALLALCLKHCVFFCLSHFQPLFFLPLSFSATLMCSVVFPALLFSLCSLRFNSLSPSCCAEKWTMICIQRTPGNWSRVKTMYSHCVCVCVCAHAKQLGPLRAFCLPVSFCYWCHISPGTHTTSSQLLVRRWCVWPQERRAHGALNHLTVMTTTPQV